MGEIGEVLELLHGARGRYCRVRGVLRIRSRGGSWDEVIRFWSGPPRIHEESETLQEVPDEARVAPGLVWRSLVDPAGWIPAFDFHVDGDAELIGRRALRVGAVARQRDDDVAFPAALEPAKGADAYELLVDRERGVVLRVAALFRGEEVWVTEFEDLRFDERIPADRFVFEARA